MNSYFKNPAEVTLLVQQGLEALPLQGWYIGCTLDVALRHDPYNLAAHYALALYYAAQKQQGHFRYHLGVCRNLEPTYYEKILTQDAVVGAFSPEDIARITNDTTQGYTDAVKEFSAIDPAGHSVYLSIRPDSKKEIADFYNSLSEKTAHYFNIDEQEYGDWLPEIDTVDFTQVHYFKVEYQTDRSQIDSPPEKLYQAFKRISPHIADVRFLITSEWDEYADEILIQDGVFYLYRHVLDADTREERLQYFETLIHQHHDAPLRQWLYRERLDNVLYVLDYKLPYGLPDTAQQELDKAHALALPDDPWLPYVQGRLFEKEGDFKNAILSFKDAIEKKLHVFEIYHELGKIQVLHTQEWEESIRHFSLALEIKHYTEIFMHRALAYLQVGQHAKAGADIKHYIEQVQPFNNSMLNTAGRFLADRGFNGEAIELFLAALEKNQAYDDELRALWEKAPSDASFYTHQLEGNTTRRANILSGLGNCVADRAQALDYSLQALALTEDALRLYNVGVILQSMRRTAEAETYYDRALAVDNTFIKALNNKSALRFEQQDYPAVIALTDQILALDQHYTEAFNTRAGALFHLGDLWGALGLYRQYLDRKPEVATGHFGVGFILMHLRKDAEAIPHLEKAIGLSPAAAPQLHEIYTNVASCYNNTGALSKALDACERSIALKPTYYHPYYVTACVLHKQGHDDDALAMARKALACDPAQRNLILNEPDLAGMRAKMMKAL